MKIPVAIPASAALAALATFLAGQAQQQPAFEVASVRSTKAADFRGGQIRFLSGGRFVATNYPLLMIITTAWNLPFQSSRLTGGPDWIRSERYDIEARAAAGSFPGGLSPQARNARMRMMLQALLADRFKLKMSRETKEMPVFTIVAGKNGPKLEKSKIEEKDCPDASSGNGVPCHVFMGGRGRGLHGQAVDMSDLAMYVENWAERPVIDKTGITGLFHIETKPWLPMTPGPQFAAGAKAEDGSDMADLPTLFGVFEQLGLKLEPQKASIDIFHIEQVEKPSQN